MVIYSGNIVVLYSSIAVIAVKTLIDWPIIYYIYSHIALIHNIPTEWYI